MPLAAIHCPPTPPRTPPAPQDEPKGQQNRLSKFTYTEGNPAATKDSEEVLVTSGEKFNNIHSAGWCGFKPSDYGKGVRTISLTVVL